MNFAPKSVYARGVLARPLTSPLASRLASLLTPLLIALLALITLPASAASAGFESTALDRYVQTPDDNYRYEVVEVVSGEVRGEAYKTYIVEMVSQQWLTEAEVNLPLWVHELVITVPAGVTSDIGFLYLTGGSNEGNRRSAAPASDIKRALQTGTVVSTLYGVPSQPLVFADDDGRRRSEDGIIAYTWDKYLRTGDDKWPLRLPMTKAAVRAMDTITDLMQTEASPAATVDQFVVAGGSKRGWTTWTTAAVDSAGHRDHADCDRRAKFRGELQASLQRLRRLLPRCERLRAKRQYRLDGHPRIRRAYENRRALRIPRPPHLAEVFAQLHRRRVLHPRLLALLLG